jgi:murein DD-endopeptidase MepM/ murein hydrolase activator NlpD
MVNPVPGHSVTTPYHKANTGSWNTCGWHTGQDYAADAGATVVAARGGQISHVDYGSSFGSHQFVVRPGDGTEDFYAHTRTRPGNGGHVGAGDYLAEVGSEGNATGPHLHFERHSQYGWSCNIMADPMLSHNDSGGGGGGDYPAPTSKTVYLSKLTFGTEDSDSVWYLQTVLNGHPLEGGATLPTTGGYFAMTDDEVRKCQTQHGFGNDAPGTSFVGKSQAAHLFDGIGLTVVDDL